MSTASECYRGSVGDRHRSWSCPFTGIMSIRILWIFLGNPKPIQEIRQRIVPLAEGNVLEIGVGRGVNFVHYDPGRANKLYALEPNPGMRNNAGKQNWTSSS